MTAIVQSLPSPRNGWSTVPQSASDGMTNTDSRIFVPRKSAQRSNSSSSVSSTSSTATTASTASSLSNGQSNGDSSFAMAPRKKVNRGIWPSSKADTLSGSISTLRSQSLPSNGTLNSSTNVSQSLNQGSTSTAQFSYSQNGTQSDVTTLLLLQPLNGTFERKSVMVPHAPDVLRIGRQTNQKTLPTPSNGYFDSKVLSRQHAELWSDREGRVSIRDVGSSNGTFVNGRRLSPENKPSETERLKEGDVLELGIDIVSEDQKTVVHHKVSARVEYAGLYTAPSEQTSILQPDLEPIAYLPPQTGLRSGRFNTSNGNQRAPTAAAAAAVAAAASGPSPYHAKWLQPVTMEQIMKRLGTELKQTRAHTSSIRSGTTVVAAALEDVKLSLATAPPEVWPEASARRGEAQSAEPQTSAPVPKSISETSQDLDFSDKGSTDGMFQIPLLRRSETEKPKSPSVAQDPNLPASKLVQTHQIRDLVEALAAAQKEIASQNQRLKDMEDALTRERDSRMHAEELVSKLETAKPNPSLLDDDVAQPEKTREQPTADQGRAGEDSDSDLQQRISLIKLEMDEMKLLMAQYKHRAEVAEHESQRDRQSLADMVESIQRREEALQRKAAMKRELGAPASSPARDALDDPPMRSLDEGLNGEVKRAQHRLQTPLNSLKGPSNGNGSPSHISIQELQRLGRAAIAAAAAEGGQDISDDDRNRNDKTSNAVMTSTRRRDQLVQSAPYASMLGVVLLGVGIMAYLNGWQKAAER